MTDQPLPREAEPTIDHALAAEAWKMHDRWPADPIACAQSVAREALHKEDK